jgi:hypothetical protein
MKSERRHELKTNSLSLMLLDLPGTIKDNLSNILLFIFIILLGVALYYYRSTAQQKAVAVAVEGISVARDGINELQRTPPFDPDFYGRRRQQLSADAATAISQVLTTSHDNHALAEALLAKGDLNWTLANSPEFPGATTRPYLKTDSTPSEYLKEASAAYQEVLAKYPEEKNAVIAAHFGLAAIAENQHNWDAAKSQYDTLLADQSLTAAYHDFAQTRMQELPGLSKPARIGNPTTAPAALPTSAPTTKSLG